MSSVLSPTDYLNPTNVAAGVAKPNLFIVGAPKCGTTSMHDYLGQHPDIFMTPNKEPRHFGADLVYDPKWTVADRDDYLGLFTEGADCAYRGESTPLYLYSHDAPRQIHAFNPDARIVIMIRNPVDMINSYHLQRINTGNEDILKLEDALAADEKKIRRAWICRQISYLEAATFSPRIEAFFSMFGRDRVHVILFDDLKDDVNRTYAECLKFLGLDSAVDVDLSVRNASRPVTGADLFLKRLYYRNRRVMGFFVKRMPAPLMNLYRRTITKFGKSRRGTGMDPALRRQLTEQFQSEIARLSTLLDRDLAHWSRGSE